MDIYSKINELKESCKNYVIVTVVKTTGSTPGKTGFKMVVDSTGASYGTVGGGAIENEAVKEALRLMSSGGESIMKEYLLNKDENVHAGDAQVLPMSCLGKAWLFYEVTETKSNVYIFGGGHVGQALTDFLLNLNYNITLIDNRKEILEKSMLKQVQIVHSEYIDYAENFTPPADSYFVIVTYGHMFDYEILKTLYKRELVQKYAGVISSKNKAKELIAGLKKDISADLGLSKLHTPIGIKIGGDSAHEIALSIAAEIQAVRYGKNITAG